MSRRLLKTSRSSALRRLIAFAAVGSAVWLVGQGALRLATTDDPASTQVSQPARAATGSELLLARERLRVCERLLRDAQRRLSDLRHRQEQFTENVLARTGESSSMVATTSEQGQSDTGSQVDTLAGLIRQRERLLETMTPAHPVVQSIERQIAGLDTPRHTTKPAKVSPKITRPLARTAPSNNERAEFDRLRTDIAVAERNVELNDADHRAALVEVARLEAPVPVAESPVVERLAAPQWLSAALRSLKLTEVVLLVAIGSGCLAAWLVAKRPRVVWYVDSPHQRHERSVHAAHEGVPKPHLRPLVVGRTRALVRPRRRHG
ncbi:MAG: hypothetical protein JSS27_20715 [Planctomycetes bacterium]|nr:hypothetical protein [Planctomycetota bacterium]